MGFSLTCLITFRHNYYRWTARVHKDGQIERFRRCRRCGSRQSQWQLPPSAGYRW